MPDLERWHPRRIFIGEVEYVLCPNCGKSVHLPPVPQKHDTLNMVLECCSVIISISPENHLYYDKESCKENSEMIKSSQDEKGANSAMTTREKLNQFYKNPDPWGFKTNPMDKIRKGKIGDVLKNLVAELGIELFKNALDIGGGEGFLSVDLPAEKITVFDISDVAISRVPKLDNVKATAVAPDPDEKFDLITCMGSLVKDYAYQEMIELMKKSTGYVLTCSTVQTEVPEMLEFPGEKVHTETFDYRDGTKQVLRLFKLGEVLPEVEEMKAKGDPGLTEEETPEPVEEIEEIDTPEMATEEDLDADEDITFRQVVDNDIDALPKDHAFNAITMTEDDWFQFLEKDESIPDMVYRGFKIILSAGAKYLIHTEIPDVEPKDENYVNF